MHYTYTYLYYDQVTQAKVFRRNYGAKLEFPEEWEGSNQKTLPWEGKDIPGTTQ